MSLTRGGVNSYHPPMRTWIAALIGIGMSACASAKMDAPPDVFVPPDAAPDAARPDAAIDAAPVPVTLSSVAVDPVASVPAGLTTQLHATAHYSDSTTADVTATATWSSSAGAIASVDAAGLVTTHAMGLASIVATVDTTAGSRTVTVDPAIVETLVVGAPAVTPLAKGLTVQLVATGTFSDGTTGDVTDRATWATTNAGVATVTGGLVTAVAASGTADISATMDAQRAAQTVTDAAAKAASLAITSGDVALAQHQKAKLHATLTFTDGTTQDVTTTAAWSSDAAGVVATGASLAAGGALATAHISAMASGFTATITATVTAVACHPVINEVQAGGASAGDEWVELYNPCTLAIDVGGWTLDYRAATTIGAQDTNLLATLTGSMQPGELRLYVGPAFSGTATADGAPWGGANGLMAGDNGAVGLRAGAKNTGTLVDGVCYGVVNAANPFLEGAAAAALASSKSVARVRFDGDDTNSNATDLGLDSLPSPKVLNNP